MRGLVTAAAIATALVAAAPAAAETQAFVAYGTGETVCTIEVSKLVYGPGLTSGGGGGELQLSGTTDCSEPVQQTGQVRMAASAADPGLDGDYCSGFVKSCFSAASEWGDDLIWENPAEYSIHLTAPSGQGWVGAPTDCTGVGTDNLSCVFTALVATPYWLF